MIEAAIALQFNFDLCGACDNGSFIPFEETSVIFAKDGGSDAEKIASVIRRDSTLILLLSWTAGSMDTISYVANHALQDQMIAGKQKSGRIREACAAWRV
jgi:hypothetical protein